MSENIVVKAKIKNITGDVSVSSDFADKLNEKVIATIKEAVARAEANGRKTVMAKDL
ncbi:MAG: DUF1931 domain-containing protein [Nanobdellota archaeon]